MIDAQLPRPAPAGPPDSLLQEPGTRILLIADVSGLPGRYRFPMQVTQGSSDADAPLPAEALQAMIDLLAWPLMLLRRDATLLHANLAAQRLLDLGTPLRRAPEGRVVASEAGRRAAFETALDITVAGGPPQMLHWSGAGGYRSATLSSLAVPGALPATLLLAVSAEAGHGADLQAYADLHGLTAAETRVLTRLALGENSHRTAAALGVTPATVRSHIAALRRKTGHDSVTTLLRTLAGFPPLLVPPGDTR